MDFNDIYLVETEFVKFWNFEIFKGLVRVRQGSATRFAPDFWEILRQISFQLTFNSELTRPIGGVFFL